MVELLLAISAIGGSLAAILGGYAAIIGARNHRVQKENRELIVKVVHTTNGMSARLEQLAFEAGERAEKARHGD